MKIILERRANPDAVCDAGPPAMWAAGSGKSATLQALLQAGADPNAAANSDVTPALAASAAGKPGPGSMRASMLSYLWLVHLQPMLSDPHSPVA